MEEVISPHTYRLDLAASIRIHDLFQLSLLRPVVTNPLDGQHALLPPPVVVDDKEKYQVEDILDSRMRRQRLEFFVKWSRY